MGFDKTFSVIAGKTVVEHSVAAFDAAPSVSEIILVGRAERLEQLRAFSFRKVRAVVAGGIQRQDSVAAGLRQLGAEAKYVAVHDAARPLVTPEHIELVFAEAELAGAAALAARVKDTLKRADEHRFVAASISRQHVYAMETPQIFERGLLEEAYEVVQARQIPITDEVSAVEELGRKVLLVPNETLNLKITYPADLQIAQLVLRDRQHAISPA